MSDFETSILSDLNTKMRCAILTNAQGEILIIHDQALDGTVDYIEHDPETQSFALIFDDGRMQELGITLDQKMKNNLMHGTEVTLTLMENKANI